MTTIQTINIGSYANDGTGDDLRTAFNKVNSNFALLQTDSGIAGATNVGSGVGIWADKNLLNLEFKSLTSTGNSVAITSTSTTVNLESSTKLSNDTSPTAGGNINLNNHYIFGGDTKTTVYGYDPRVDTVLLELLMDTNNLTVDMGTFNSPTGYETNPVVTYTSGGSGGYSWDFGSGFSLINNKINFGTYTSSDPIQDAKDHQLSLTGNLTLSGGHNLTLTVSANSQLTLPQTGTIASLGNSLGQFANTTSLGLYSIMTDPTGTGSLVFATSPTISAPTLTGHPTIEGITSTGATGTGNLVFSNTATLNSPSLTGSPVIGGVTLTGATGSGNIVFNNGPSFSGTAAFTNISTSGLTLRNVNFIAVGSTNTYAVSTTTSYNVLVVSATGLTVTVTMPPSPVDQQLCSFTVASNTISTLNMTAGPTVIPPFTGTNNVTSGTVYQYVYRASTTTWYRN